MESSQRNAAATTQEIVAKIDQKALRLSALLRDIDNHPLELQAQAAEQLGEILEMLACRIAATQALLTERRGEPIAAG